MSWEKAWGGSKSALSANVREYARQVGESYSEILLTLLHEAVADLRDAEHLHGVLYEFPSWLRSELRDRGMSQKDLAELMGVSPSIISGYATGKHHPNLRTVLKIIDALEES